MSLRRQAGFTLIELVIAITIVSIMAVGVAQTLWRDVATRDMILEELEPPKVEDAILDMVARDLRFLYYRAGLLPADAGFWGRTKQMNGIDADRIDFITARTSRIATLEDATSGQPGDSPLTEVGYACRPNDANTRWLELWRREDYYVDDDPTDGGRFSLIYDKIRRFSLRYYAAPDETDSAARTTDSGREEWDSKQIHKVPYAIILDLQYDVREPAVEEPQAKVTKIFLLKPGRSLPLEAAMTTTPGMG